MNDISTIKAGIDLIAVMKAAGVDVKRSSSRWMACCPWHEDTVPSLVIYPDDHWYCFSCQDGGDVIDFIQKFHSCTFKEALGILGIEQGELTPEKREEIKRLQHRHELIKTFREWEAEASAEVGMFCRCCRKVLGQIKTEDDLDKYGERYHDLASYEYHLDVLVGNDDQAKFGLWEADYYG